MSDDIKLPKGIEIALKQTTGFSPVTMYTADQLRAAVLADREGRGKIEALALHVVNSARSALDASTEANDEDMSLLVPSHLHAAMSLAVDEYDAQRAKEPV